MQVLKKMPIVLMLIIIAMLSFLKLTPVATSEKTHSDVIKQIDREIASVMKLTAGATGASAAISLLPDDSCTPIAEEFAELGKYFIVVLSALYLEKYLVSILGYAAFGFFIPLSFLIFGFGFWNNREKIKIFSVKLLIFGIVLYGIIPFSVKTSETVYNNYENSIEETLNTANEISVAGEDEGTISKFISWVENAAGTIADYVTGLFGRFVEAVAVMIVTSCLIPVLVVILFVWLMKILFGLDVSITKQEWFEKEAMMKNNKEE